MFTYSQTSMFSKDHTHNLPLVDVNLTTEQLNYYCNRINNYLQAH